MRKPPVGFPTYQILSAGIMIAFSSSTLASGFALIEQSASQQGNAYAGAAAFANDASTIYFNPAGMTRLSRQLVAGAHWVAPSAKFDGTATDPAGFPVSGGNGGDGGKNGIVPNLYFAAPLGSDVFFGVGVNAPFGLTTEYDDDWKGRYHAIESELQTVNINPSLAYRINNKLSVGAGFNIQYIDVKLTQYIDQGSLCLPTQQQLQAAGFPGADPALCAGLTPQSADAFAKVEGDDWAGGYNIGLLYEPIPSTRIGLSYRSKIQQSLTGKAKFRDTIPQFSSFNIFVRTDATAEVDLPQTVSLSVYHDINSRWSVMADATWTGWDNFDELRIEYDSLQPDTVVDENWDDTWRFSLGVDYRFNSSWTFRAGTAFDESPIPDAEHRTARIPGDDRIWASLGFGYQATATLGIDVAYTHLFVDDPKINSGEPTTGNINGEYDADTDIISAQVVWKI
jgi:long-chain fatty acid transport protein